MPSVWLRERNLHAVRVVAGEAAAARRSASSCSSRSSALPCRNTGSDRLTLLQPAFLHHRAVRPSYTVRSPTCGLRHVGIGDRARSASRMRRARPRASSPPRARCRRRDRPCPARRAPSRPSRSRPRIGLDVVARCRRRAATGCWKYGSTIAVSELSRARRPGSRPATARTADQTPLVGTSACRTSWPLNRLPRERHDRCWTRCYLTSVTGIVGECSWRSRPARPACSATAMNARAAGDSGSLDHDRHAGVAAFADRLVDRNAAEERNRQVGRQRLAAAVSEDVGLVAAVRAREVAHVLDQADRPDVELLVHPHRAAACRPATPAAASSRRSRRQTGTVWLRLSATSPVPGRHVDDQVVEIVPAPPRGRTAESRRAASARAR